MEASNDYKEETKKTYNLYADKFEVFFRDQFHAYRRTEADKFLAKVKGPNIVDLGSGPGTYAEYFNQKGFNTLCIDNSEEMINRCLKKGLAASLMDLENLQLKSESFHGAWAYASLVHISKSKIQDVVKNILGSLTSNGVIGLSLLEGDGERFELNSKYPDTQRWFSYYQDQEVRNLFSSYRVVSFSRIEIKNYAFLNYIFEK